MEFLVKGVDENGREREFSIDGESEEAVLEQAKMFGFTTTEIRAASCDEVEACHAVEKRVAEKERRVAEEGKRVAEELRAAEQRRAIEKLRERCLLASERLRKSIDTGRRLFMYRTQLLSVDSDLEGQRISNPPDLSELQRLGLDSWEVTGVISRTSGTSLQNDVFESIFAVGKANAGGIGGIVNGVYILLRKEILAADLDPEPSDEVMEYLRDYI